MENESYDELHFRMVNGETHVKRVEPGQGPREVSQAREWVAVDETTFLRVEHVVTVRVTTNAQEHI